MDDIRDRLRLNECRRQQEALEDSEHEWVPVVKFLNGMERAIYPESFKREVYKVGTVRRVQTPLKLAWAMTARAAAAGVRSVQFAIAPADARARAICGHVRGRARATCIACVMRR